MILEKGIGREKERDSVCVRERGREEGGGGRITLKF